MSRVQSAASPRGNEGGPDHLQPGTSVRRQERAGLCLDDAGLHLDPLAVADTGIMPSKSPWRARPTLRPSTTSHRISPPMSTHNERARAVIRGAVQGVGFRPFVYRLAKGLDLTGWVSNTAQGVFIEVEGAGATLREFLVRLEREKPPRAIIQSLEFSFLDAIGYEDSATIRASEQNGAKTAYILPGHRHLPRLSGGDFPSRQPPSSLSLHQLHQLRPLRFTIIEVLSLRSSQHLDEKIHDVHAREREYHDPPDRRFPRPA